VIDLVGPSHFQGNLDVAATDGHIVNLGFMSGTRLPAEIDMSAFIRERLRFEGSSLRSRNQEYQGKLRDKLKRRDFQVVYRDGAPLRERGRSAQIDGGECN
jgi:NADPH:quinone reductase-like Zn-dependent oxidoreductase